MMDQFTVQYIPGGMTLNHSGWWLCMHGNPIKMLRKADYK